MPALRRRAFVESGVVARWARAAAAPLVQPGPGGVGEDVFLARSSRAVSDMGEEGFRGFLAEWPVRISNPSWSTHWQGNDSFFSFRFAGSLMIKRLG